MSTLTNLQFKYDELAARGVSAHLVIGIVASFLIACASTNQLAEPIAEKDFPLSVATVVMKDMSYSPDTLRVVARQPLMVTFVNEDTVNHDFVINTAERSVHLFVPPGRRIATSLYFDSTQTLRFVCSQKGHEAAGMVGTLVVESASQ